MKSRDQCGGKKENIIFCEVLVPYPWFPLLVFPPLPLVPPLSWPPPPLLFFPIMATCHIHFFLIKQALSNSTLSYPLSKCINTFFSQVLAFFPCFIKPIFPISLLHHSPSSAHSPLFLSQVPSFSLLTHQFTPIPPNNLLAPDPRTRGELARTYKKG